MRTMRLARMLVSVCLLGAAAIAQGSTITPQGGQDANFQPDFINGEDFLYIAPPNASGISVNHFTTFNVNEPLKLINAPRADQVTQAQVGVAKTLVIVAPNIQLSSQIDIVGPATDVVFLSQASGGGSINCNSCVINNALRLSLISAAQQNFTQSSSGIGTLTTQGNININSLYAPGIVGLDLVAQQVSTFGEVNINQAAMKSYNSSYTASPNGSYSMGTGGIDLVSGSFKWNYERRQMAEVTSGAGTQSIGGTFKAPRVHISTSSNLQFTGRVDTRVDVLSAVSYEGSTLVPQEGIALQALYKSGTTGVDVTVTGDLFTDNTVDIRATRDVNLLSSSDIQAAGVKALAVGDLFNDANVKGVVVAMAAEELINEGRIEASDKVDLWSEKDLANQYGGVIQGETILLSSQNAVVRNGSRTPYRTEASNRNNFLDFTKSDILGNYLFSLFDSPEESYFYDSTRLGAFYLSPSDVQTASVAGLTFPTDYSSHIIGDAIEIKAPAFENINPYYVRVDEQDSVALERQLISQVSVSAESSFVFYNAGSADYMVNASALLSVNSPSGEMIINAERVINQRYRVATYLVPTLTDVNNTSALYMFQATATTTGFQSLTAVYSPPGFMMSLGFVNIKADTYFANILGYVEFFKGMDLISPSLKNFGLSNQAFEKTTVSYYNVFLSQHQWESSSVLRDPRELDTLFHVSGGAIEATTTDAWFETLNPFLYFVNMAAQQAADNEFNDSVTSTTCTTTYCGGMQLGSTLRTTTTYDFQLAGGEALTNALASGQILVDVNRTRVSEYFYHENGQSQSTSNTTVTTTTESYSLFNELKKLYYTLRDTFEELLEEFNWWGLAE